MDKRKKTVVHPAVSRAERFVNKSTPLAALIDLPLASGLLTRAIDRSIAISTIQL